MITEYPHTEKSLVYSLNGGVGCGKTTFLTMFNNLLTEEGYEAVYINAWKNDLLEEPLITISSELIEHLEKTTFPTQETKGTLKDSLKSIIGISASISACDLSMTVGSSSA